MATRSEQYHADEQRRGDATRGKRDGRAKPGIPPEDRSPDKESSGAAGGSRSSGGKHAGQKATHALEEVEDGKRPSRKSTRGGANHTKPDSGLGLRAAQAKAKPEAVAARARVRNGMHVSGR